MKKQKPDKTPSLISYKHSMLTRAVACLLIISFISTNVTYGHDRGDTLRMARENGATEERLREEFGQPPAEARTATVTEEGKAGSLWNFMQDIFGHTRKDVQLELTTWCPLACRHCLTWDKMCALRHSKDSPQMDYELAESIIRGFKGAEKLCFTGGEPFLYGQTVEELLAGKYSAPFMRLVELACEMVDEVVLDTSGISIPVTGDINEDLKFFERFPEKVTFELSLDDEHEERIRALCKKELKDIVQRCEMSHERGRTVQYNLRYRNPGDKRLADMSVLEEIRKWDWKKNGAEEPGTIESHWGQINMPLSYDGSYSAIIKQRIRSSRVKLQGNAVNTTEIAKGRMCHELNTDEYALMEMDKYAEHIFPDNIFLFIGHDGQLFFDAHSGFMDNPPSISMLGRIDAEHPLFDVMFDGIFGRLVNFERYPYLRQLYLARFYADNNEPELAREYLEAARRQGSAYEARYRKLKDSWSAHNIGFSEIALGDEKEFHKHFYVAILDNFMRYKKGELREVTWWRDIIPRNVRAVWEITRKDEDKYRVGDLKQAWENTLSNIITPGCVTHFVRNAPDLDNSLDESAEEIIRIIESGRYVIDRKEIGLKTGATKEGGFIFIPFSRKTAEAKPGFDSARPFSAYLKLLKWAMPRESFGSFLTRLETKLEHFESEGKTPDPHSIANRYSEAVWFELRELEGERRPEEDATLESAFSEFIIEHCIARLRKVYYDHAIHLPNIVSDIDLGAEDTRVLPAKAKTPPNAEEELQVRTLTKELTEAHIDELVSVGTEAYAPTGEPLWGKPEFLSDSIDGGRTPLGNKWRYSQIAFYRGRVVGYLIVYQRDDKVIVSRFAVLPELQRKGIGVAIELIRKANEAVLQDGVTHVETSVYCENPIINLYTKLGFRQIGLEERDGKRFYKMRLVVAELNIPGKKAEGRTSTTAPESAIPPFIQRPIEPLDIDTGRTSTLVDSAV